MEKHNIGGFKPLMGDPDVMDCIAIDFETANASRSSPCAVGVAAVKDGQVSETFYALIKPFDNHFDPFNISIHGITPKDVARQPEFPSVWKDLKPLLESDPVIAHNAAFDMSVLRHTLNLYGLTFPTITYTCSRIIAQKSWPTLLSYALPIVTDYLGIELEHHNALSDAKASSLIAHQACKKSDVTTLDSLADKCGIRHGCIMGDGSYRPASGYSNIDVKAIVPTTKDSDEAHPFYGRVLVFTGTLQTMKRRDAMQCVVDVGGQVGNGVTKETHFLVLGEQDFRKFAEGQTKSSKLRKAEALKQNGHDIELLSENDYLEMLGREIT